MARRAAKVAPAAPVPAGVLPEVSRAAGSQAAADSRAALRVVAATRPGAAPARASYYQFGGDYWVIVLRNDQPVPIAVKTGLTDLEYSEIVSGLQPGDRVLLLPSASLFDQQERLQQFISSRFSSTPFQQNQNQQFRGRPPF